MTTTLKIHDEAHKDITQPLLLKDAAGLIDVKQSTLAKWSMEFRMFIPTVKQGRKKYFRPEAVEVLRHIRDLKEEEYNKLQIMESLTKEFPIDIDKEEVIKAYNAKGNSKRKENQDVLYLAIRSFDEIHERLDQLIQQVGERNPENKRIRELLQEQRQMIECREEKDVTETDPQQQQGGSTVIQRHSVEERDRDLLLQLRKTIEEKEKLKRRGFFARLVNR